MGYGKLAIGILAGVAAGTLLGILIAPDKGVKTRKKISRKSDEYVNDLKEQFEDFLDNIQSKFSSAEEGSEEAEKKPGTKNAKTEAKTV